MTDVTSAQRMQSSLRAPSYRSYKSKRPQSAELVDLHVYIVPPDIWREQYNNLLNQNVTETVSAGIIRVHPEVKVYSLREEIDQQIGAELLPQDYVFLKSVGRSITRLKPKQEYQLKAKHFIPPQAYAPEIYLLEVGPGDSRGSTQPHSPSIGQPYNHPSYNNQHPYNNPPYNQESEDGSQTGKNRHMHSTSSPYRYSPLPKIKQSRSSATGESPRPEYGNHNGDTRHRESRESINASQSWDPSKHRSPDTGRPSSQPRDAPKSHKGSRPTSRERSRERSRHSSQERGRPTSRERGQSRHTSRGRDRGSPSSRGRDQGTPTSQHRRSDRHESAGHNSASPTPSSDRDRDRDHHRDHRDRDRDRRGQDRSPHKHEKYDGTYTNHTNEDSGINVITPEEHYDALDRRKPEEHRQPDAHSRLQPGKEDYDEDRQRRSREDQEREEWERKRREEEERRRLEEEERRRREEEDRLREEDERRRREEERELMAKDQKLTGSDEVKTDLGHHPSEGKTDRNWRGNESVASYTRKDTRRESVLSDINKLSSVNEVFVDSVTPERYRNGYHAPGEGKYPQSDSRIVPYEDDRVSDISRTSRHNTNISEAPSGSRVVVQINDEINGKITPRVIVSLNGGDTNRSDVGLNSYVKNRLKPYESGYLSGDRYDSDHSLHSNMSNRSRRSNGRVSNRSQNRIKSSFRRRLSLTEHTNRSDGYNYDHTARSKGYGSQNDVRYEESEIKREATRTYDSPAGGNTQKSQGTNESTYREQINNTTRQSSQEKEISDTQLKSKIENKEKDLPKTSTTADTSSSHVSEKVQSTIRNGTFVENTSNENDGNGTYSKEDNENKNDKDGNVRNGILQNNDRKTDVADDDVTKKKPKEVKWSDDVRPNNEDEKKSAQVDDAQGNTMASEWSFSSPDGRKSNVTLQTDGQVQEQSGQIDAERSVDNDKAAAEDEAKSKNDNEARHTGDTDEVPRSSDQKLSVPKQDYDTSQSFVKSDSDTVQSSHYHGDVSDNGDVLGQQDPSQRRKAKGQRTKDQADKDLNRFPSPPPMQVHDSSHPDRDTESAKRRRKEEKERLLRELEQAREARRVIERQREELVKKAKAMQSKTQNRRNHARDVWKKRYFEEKKKTPPLEEHCNRLRHELDIIHRKLMTTLEGPSKDKSTRGAADMKPSQKNNYKIQATRLTHEIDDMRRRLENAKMKLTAEMKLRNQAETELRALRAELTQKKIHLTLTRNQQLAAMTPGTGTQDMYMAPALTPKS